MEPEHFKLFEAFFWIEPVRPSANVPFQSTRVVWHYPQNVQHITSAFRDIPQFCFPDLEKVQLERTEFCKNEFFTFTLTEGDGNRVYGVCMRPFFRGECLRYDAKRRTRHCLCIITQRPIFSILRTVLLQVHGLTMLDSERPGSTALAFLSVLLATEGPRTAQLVVRRTQVPALLRDFVLQLPRGVNMSSESMVPILPLLEALGAEQFMLLLSAALCERRIVFVADDVEKLSSSVLAVASMLQPFDWQHIFIPLLPSTLFDYVAAPMPFMIGIRRYLLPKLERIALDACVIVDVDAGSLRCIGNVKLKDLVGDCGSKTKQASEAVEGMVKAGAGLVNMLMGRGETNDQGPRDLMVVLMQDLGRVLSSRPGSDTLRGVASGLVKSLAGTSKPVEESRVQWMQEGERAIRDTLLLFFVYLFSEVDSFAASRDNGRTRSTSFDIHSFMIRRSQMGDSRELIEFMAEFRHSQMFERFCDSRSKRTDSGPSDDDVFESTCRDLQSRRVPVTIASVKSAIGTRSLRRAVDQHVPTAQYVDGRLEGSALQHSLERILSDASSEQVLGIFRTIAFKLEACRASSAKGSAGSAGLRALILLRTLLLSGPQCVLSHALDLIPALRALLNPLTQQKSVLGSALQAVSQGIMPQAQTDVRAATMSVLLLLLDHQRLQHQRLFALLARENKIPSLRVTMQRIKFPPLTHFATLHNACRPEFSGQSHPPLIRLSVPVRASVDDCDEPTAVPASLHASIVRGPSTSSSSKTVRAPSASAPSIAHFSLPPSEDDFQPPISVPPTPTVPLQTRAEFVATSFVQAPISAAPAAPVFQPSFQAPKVISAAPSAPSSPPRPVKWVTDPNGELVPAKEPPALLNHSEVCRPPSVPMLRGFGSQNVTSSAHESSSAPTSASMLRGFGPPAIPPEFRVVNKDTGEISDLRMLPGAQSPPSSGGATVEQRMTAIYQKYNPAKVGDVPLLLQKYKGREAEMLAKLEDKYSPVPVFVNGTQIHPSPSSSASAVAQRPITLIQQLSMPVPPEPAANIHPASGFRPSVMMPAAWKPGMPIPFSQPQPSQGKPSDPFADLVCLRK